MYQLARDQWQVGGSDTVPVLSLCFKQHGKFPLVLLSTRHPPSEELGLRIQGSFGLSARMQAHKDLDET